VKEKKGPVSRITFAYHAYAGLQHTSWIPDGDRLPGARRRRFHIDGGRSWTFSSGTSRGPAVDVFTLMVGAPGPSALAPPGGPPSTFSR
jgi:hypothetical protein